MQLRHFVSGSAVILGGWLAVTFVYKVPSQRYPKLDKYPATSGMLEKKSPLAPIDAGGSAVVRISHSR